MNICYLCNKPQAERVLYINDVVDCGCRTSKVDICVECDTYWSSSYKLLDELWLRVGSAHMEENHYPVDLI